MADIKDDWSDWNPIAQHYFEETSNKYEKVMEAPAKDNDNLARLTKQLQYPYLVIKKKNQFITENLLRNYFGDIIYEIEYRSVPREFHVYFHNIGSLEAAWTKIHQFPNIVHCVDGRGQQSNSFNTALLKESEVKTVAQLPPSSCEPNSVNLESRTIQLSANKKKHPEFFKSPIVIKSDYSNKSSQLAANDENFRYLNVKYEFMLERHGAYNLEETIEKGQAVLHFRSGRSIVTPKNQLEAKPTHFELQLEKLAKKCFSCKCYTDNSCKFCQMPFCNTICFDALAAVHKESCNKGSPPVIDDTIISKFTKLKLPPSGSNVKISAFEQSNVLYVRSAEIVAEIAYYKVLSDVMFRGKVAPKLMRLPHCGQIVIHKSSIQTVRAMVLNVDNPQAIYVVCVDYGNIEVTALDTLYECSDYLAGLPRYVVPVLLRGVPRRFMSPNLRSMLYELDHTYTFVLKYSEREFDPDKGMQRVILIESELNRSLNRLIKTIVTPVEPSISEIGCKEDFLQHVHLPTGKNIELVVMDNTFIKFGVIHCTILDYAYEITEMQRDMQFYGDSIAKCEFFAASKNDLCIAKYQDKWCRGVCMELVGDGHPSILFIDYGNIAAIHVNDIRPYPPQFTFPILTTEYDLLDMPVDITEEQLTRLEKHLAIGAIINCDEVIYNEVDNNYSLRLDAVQKLTM
ncbi:protein vreteno [Drosophila hydei]|uniref:Protein vreteno n=1 Tax=Drosophila hydei TaxID=7224 RepID=A0A6J1LE61_DROHY|nr:protein vreteno [Drosophila hydei]